MRFAPALVGLAMLTAPPASAQEQCRQDWSKCADNRQLAENYRQWPTIVSACQEAGYAFIAPYGIPNRTPRFNTARFSSYAVGNDYPRTGIAVAAAAGFEYQDTKGARKSAALECLYDLRKDRVVEVKFVGRAP
jgi:hypothetical protein